MSTDPRVPLAHSAPSAERVPDPYARHVAAVRDGALRRADAMLQFSMRDPARLRHALEMAGVFHDLGKLDDENQAGLERGRGHSLPWDHIDAGVAWLSICKNIPGAWLVRAHHAPGLPDKREHFNPDFPKELRGRRNDAKTEGHAEQIARTNAQLSQYLKIHEEVLGKSDVQPSKDNVKGLTLRLLLACLVDADHADTAWYDKGVPTGSAALPRWDERLQQLIAYVGGLGNAKSDAESERNLRRNAFFEGCLASDITAPMVSCKASVGMGKTTAVMAYLLRRARDEGLRRIIVVAPYTNILAQTAKRLREALVLAGEDPEHVVMEHHHQADFNTPDFRSMAALWDAPIVLTTAVSFFETLASCNPSSLRKLHALPGSGVFIDESHAALPVRLWPQNWAWLDELARFWRCRFVFSSGTLAKFWENDRIVPRPQVLPELLPESLAGVVLAAEQRRIRFEKLPKAVLTYHELANAVQSVQGPRLVILNTVNNAARFAKLLKDRGKDVLHISTALTPTDRRHLIETVIKRKFEEGKQDWTLVATSCVEAGVDLSFRCAFRQRASVASAIQVGGRVNRNGEYDADGGGVVYDFDLHDTNATNLKDLTTSADVMLEFLEAGSLSRDDPSLVVTRAMEEELRRLGGMGKDQLVLCEQAGNYPGVAEAGRVIDADTRLVVVDPALRIRIKRGLHVSYRELLGGSVQVWSTRIAELTASACLTAIASATELYEWNATYDSGFLGIMAGILETQEMATRSLIV